MLGHFSARPILIGVPAITELGFGLDHQIAFCLSMIFSENRSPLFRIMLWSTACELAKLVATATILNPLAPPASTQIGAILANASSSDSSARARSEPDSGARKDRERKDPDKDGASAKTAKNGARLDLFKFVPFRLNRLSAEVSSALSAEYQTRYGLDIPEWRVLATLGFRDHACSAQYIAHCTRTVKGKALYEELIPRLLRREQEILACLSAPERKNLAALLGKIEASLDLVQTSAEADAKEAY
jgi:hypothetical protein